MSYTLMGKIKRAIRKPPRYVVKRLWLEAERQLERKRAPQRAHRFKDSDLLKRYGCHTIKELWQQLADQPYCANTSLRNLDTLAAHLPQEQKRILQLAEKALKHEVDLLGSGPIFLGETIDWHQDYKTGRRWKPRYCHDIEYNNLDEPSDVKVPWELSRMQWMIPLGQAYLLTQEAPYAEAVKELIIHWVAHNPVAMSINWSCTMDVALRLMTWTWFFHVFKDAPSWNDEAFQLLFLKSLYLHGDFTSRNLESSDVNGNHYTTDAAGLVFAGLFFQKDKTAQTWQARGWQLLCQELLLQTSEDGVDFEASTAYHRLVLELFLLPALYRQAYGLPVDTFYLHRLQKMADYVAAYSRSDGSLPLFGDFDDGRALPFSLWPMNEHRYLCFLTDRCTGQDTQRPFAMPLEEPYWFWGDKVFDTVASPLTHPSRTRENLSFPPGYYISRNECDHLFIDCAEVGMNGKGGHGHNDCLSFALMLCHQSLIIDRGAYLYTANAKARNDYRSTHSHNTPQVDGAEINRFITWDFLWSLKYEAKPTTLRWETADAITHFVGTHSGYERLKHPVSLERHITLNHHTHTFTVTDSFESEERHTYCCPLWLDPAVRVGEVKNNSCILEKNGHLFSLSWQSDTPWDFQIEQTTCSPSYGREQPTCKLYWRCQSKRTRLSLSIAPIKTS